MDQPDGWPTGAAPAPEYRAEDKRLAVLARYRLDELENDEELSSITRFAAHLCDVPVAHINIAGASEPTFLAHYGEDLTGAPHWHNLCSQAMTTAELTEVADAASHPRLAEGQFAIGGEQVRFFAGAPLISHEGAPLGALCVADCHARPGGLSDVQREGLEVLARSVMRRLRTRRLRLSAEAQRDESARAMREIADMLPAIIWSADGHGRFDYFNRKWSEVTGADKPSEVADWRHVVHQNDADSTFAKWQESFAAGEPFESQYRLKQADGSWRWMLARALPFRGADGRIVRWYGTLTDIDEGHRLSQSRDLLARELSHRIKNIFAVISGLVALRARKHQAANSFADEVVGAIHALGRAHEFVRPLEGEKGESLRGLLAELMAPYQDGDCERVRIEGGDCAIGPRAAMPLALVFHELATNSAKYGALSIDSGEVAIALDCPDDHDIARIHWRERGGPRVGEPNEDGFGSRLIRMSVEGQLSGRLERRFEPDGFELDLELKSSTIRS